MKIAVSVLGKLQYRETAQERKYTGDERSGVCTCTHTVDEHHLLPVLDREYSEMEYYLPAECLKCGCTEYKDLRDEASNRS